MLTQMKVIVTGFKKTKNLPVDLFNLMFIQYFFIEKNETVESNEFVNRNSSQNNNNFKENIYKKKHKIQFTNFCLFCQKSRKCMYRY